MSKVQLVDCQQCPGRSDSEPEKEGLCAGTSELWGSLAGPTCMRKEGIIQRPFPTKRMIAPIGCCDSKTKNSEFSKTAVVGFQANQMLTWMNLMNDNPRKLEWACETTECIF